MAVCPAPSQALPVSPAARVAGSPNAIAYAIGAISQMSALRGRVTDQDMADIAAYVAHPAVPSPNLQLATFGPAASPYTAERLEFSAPASSSIRLINAGALPLGLGSAPVLSGPAVADYSIAATDCRAGAVLAAQQFCTIEIAFAPRGEPGLRAATVSVSHDWIRASVHIALIGRVAAP
jgi:hypothetical protein